MKKLVLLLPALFLSACTHTLNLRANHFASPVVEEEQWRGHVAVGFVTPTKVTLINDTSANPPTRTNLVVNQDLEVLDLFFINNISLDVGLTLTPSLEAYVQDGLLGLRWQFLNNGNATNDVWVASLQGGLGSKTKKTTDSADSSASSASSNVTITQVGASVGYKTTHVVPYVSLIRETYKVSTSVKNPNGSFGPYSDDGAHDFLAVGLSSHGKGVRYAFEYSMVNINWDRLTRKEYQNAIGLNLGYTW